MSKITINSRISLAQAKTAIATVGDKRTCIPRGEPGCGKSSLLTELASKFPSHRPVYIDCQLLLDQGDFFDLLS